MRARKKEIYGKNGSGNMRGREIEIRGTRRKGEQETGTGKIAGSKYNRWYKVIRKERIPEYLQKGREERSWSRIARFRLSNEVREGLYYIIGKEEKKRKCRICEREEET